MKDKAPAMAIITIVAVIAIVGLVLVFSGARTGRYTGGDKLYGGGAYMPGGEGTYDRYVKAGADIPAETGPRVGGIIHADEFASESPYSVHQRVSPYKTASQATNPCNPGFIARDRRYADYSVVDMQGTEWDCTYAASLATN